MEYKISEGNYRKFGVEVVEDGIVFTFAGEKDDACFLLFYDDKNQLIKRIEAPKEYCMGAVRSVLVQGLNKKKLRYNYEINGEVICDTYAERIIGRKKWNDLSREESEYQIYCGYEDADFDWKNDCSPEISKSQMVMYKLHVRGFSMDAGLRGKEKGTFRGVMGKIPYLKELGITTIEFMPVYEFEEIVLRKNQALPDYLVWQTKEEDLIKPDQKIKAEGINYWGYTKGNYFAVKASYSCNANVSLEFKELVRMLHENRMECIMEMHFEDDMNQNVILDALRYWVREYHVDGFHLLGKGVPVSAISQVLFLKRTKIFYEGFDWQYLEKESRYPHLYAYNDEYLYPARKLLSHMGGSIEEFANQQRKQNELQGFVNYITNNNGYTLWDLFSYQEKHNEANGEANADGNNWNFSSNCGVEGKTGKRFVNELRRKQVCNAFAMLLMGQGVPLILAGDEMCNTQLGNNNAYCQDNKISWLNWKKDEKNAWLKAFVTKLIAFRKAHPILTLEQPMKLNDYGHKGVPDLSYHGENAWISSFMAERAAFGIMYCGDYAKKENDETDDFVYVGYNFQAGITHLALPKLPKKKKWYLVMNTEQPENAFLEKELLLENQQLFAIKAQSTVILIGK